MTPFVSEQSDGRMTDPGSIPGAAARTYDAAHNPEVVRWLPADARLVLDLGCGTGGNAAYLAGRGITVDGVTLSASEAGQARQWCRRVIMHDLELGLPDDTQGPYDAVLCSHVLEHIRFPQKLLGDIHARFRCGGTLIAAVPNLLHYKTRINLLRGRFEYQQGGIMDDTHFRWYTLSTITRLMLEHDFSVERAYGSGGMALGPLRRVVPQICRCIDLAACRLSPGLFGWQLLVVATRSAE
jgi:2-polyprenyl-3-methyl-5-hydroxy-6-metoxy-1,4-benzoquinol methylase